MSGYEAPTITDLGSVADFTRGDGWHRENDGTYYLFGHDTGIIDNFGPGS